MRLFLDTNVLMDFLVHDRPNSYYSTLIFETVKKSSLEAWMTTQSIIDAAYIVGRDKGYVLENFRNNIRDILRFVNVGGMSFFDLKDAINASEIDDIEDCAQAFFAEDNHCDIIITSDKDFRIPDKMNPTPVMTPEAFIARLKRS